MPDLPARPDLGQLRNQAKDLLRAARNVEPNAIRRIGAVSHRMVLASAQLAVAREYGFASWPQLKTEVTRRDVLNSLDLGRLSDLLAEDPSLAVTRCSIGVITRKGPRRWDIWRCCGTTRPAACWRDVAGAGALARALIEAGAPVNGDPGEKETPLITAASYGDAEVAQVLITAGADLEATAADDAGGVPGGTALLHAAVFGVTDVLDVLLFAGASVHSIEEAAAAGDTFGWLRPDTPAQARVRALVMAADHERLGAIDELLAAGTPIDANDEVWGRQALRVAAQNARVASVEHLLARGADPNVRDPQDQRTALEWSRRARAGVTDGRAHDRVEAILRAATA